MKPATRTFLCIGGAWILLVCYSVLLTGAIEGVISFFNDNIMDLSSIVPPNTYVRQIAIFLYGLAIVSFLGGSQIPAVFLRKKSFIVQFGFSAAFGFMLLVLNILGDTLLQPLNNELMLFFSQYPLIALEYLSLPYISMVFIDFHLSGRLDAFSWRHFKRFLIGTFVHPRQAFQDILSCRSILFSFVTVVVVAVACTFRTIVVSQSNHSLRRWELLPILGMSGLMEMDPLFKTALIIPVLLFLWLLISTLLHGVCCQLGGKSTYSCLNSLTGFTFLPFLVAAVVDMIEIGTYRADNVLVLDVVFLILGFIIPLILWPLALVAIAIHTSQKLELRRTVITTFIAFLPWFVLVTLIFL